MVFVLCSFSLFAQRKRTKRKGSRSLGRPLADFPRCSQKTGDIGKSFHSAESLFRSLLVLLGCVKRQETFFFNM